MSPHTRAHSRVHTRGGGGIARAVALVADVAAFLIVLWIVLWLLDANQGNSLVAFVHDCADWLTSWSRDLFSFDSEGARVVVGYGLAAVVYLLAGHGLANWLARR
ncbi:hypothetical protein ABZZ17_39785 [Streptomyces sp. NPDC006512]|uniref:hypothetical protein n=1 Tax=Streptomyces sp. NPDC006512 TaxID=3154307 RepID=UPI0033B41237